MKNKDVVLIARPDHSLRIYEELERSSLSYIYYTFKVFPKWVKTICHNRKLVCLDGDYSSSFLMTLYNVFAFRYNVRCLKKISECKLFESFLSPRLDRINAKVIHYWPKYCKHVVRQYKLSHPETKTFADLYVPNPKFVLEYMEPFMTSLGLDSKLDYLRDEEKDVAEVMDYETDFFVPSEFVAQSYRKYYPGKNYHVISYGITIWEGYKKKDIPSAVKSFVYAGAISVEKGCDIICEYFSKHPEKELHLYGNVSYNEDSIFDRYHIHSNIVFHGSVAKAILQSELAKYDCGVHMSRFDAYSLSVGEMIGAGLPVIVSSNTGIRDDVLRYKFGIVSELTFDSFGYNVDSICNLELYEQFVDSIDSCVKAQPIKYERAIVNSYLTEFDEN